MPRLVRRQPLSERIKAALDPYDLFLWLSEELHDSQLDEILKDWTMPIGIAANIIFLTTRANSGRDSYVNNDVFGDYEGSISSGWFRWLVSHRSRHEEF